jgi:hypothetical protein
MKLTKEEQTTEDLIDNIKSEQDLLVSILPKSLDDQEVEIIIGIHDEYLYDNEVVMNLYTRYKELCAVMPNIVDRLKVMNAHINLLFLKAKESDNLKQIIKQLEYRLKELEDKNANEQESSTDAEQ